MNSADTPRVSILIPNFNNGRESSLDGQRDLIGDLLQSLHDTLKDDPTPLEIIAYDDGSTDDSLETLRQWSKKTWRGGEPFLELIEAEHCGVLAKTANIMSRRARGEFLARLDGDTICLTPNWASLLCDAFDNGPDRLGVVGPKQLRPDMRIHAYGDFILHPHGYIHVATGLPRDAVRYPLEVDHVMGCFYCCRKAVFDDLDGYDENFLRGQTIDFGLRARLHGWRAIAVPHIEFIHAHGTRKNRATSADSAEGIARTLKIFENKWGFSRIAPDLDAVRRLYGDSPLLWNRDVFGGAQEKTFDVNQSAWARYGKEPDVQQHINFRVGVAMHAINQLGKPQNAFALGCDGLPAHLLATQGVNCTGIDADPQCIAIAKQASNRRWLVQDTATALPLTDGEADMIMLFDVLDTHPNPAGLLKDVSRCLQPGKPLLIVNGRGEQTTADPSDPAADLPPRALRFGELLNVVQAAGQWALLTPPKDDPSRDMIVLVQRPPRSAVAAA